MNSHREYFTLYENLWNTLVQFERILYEVRIRFFAEFSVSLPMSLLHGIVSRATVKQIQIRVCRIQIREM